MSKRELTSAPTSAKKRLKNQATSLEQQVRQAKTLGQKVAVFWPKQNRSFIATITGYDETTGMSEILYDHEAISDQRVLSGQPDVKFIDNFQTQSAAVTEDGRRVVFPKHLACQACVKRGIMCDGSKPCSFCTANDVSGCNERYPTKEELTANPVLEYVTQKKLTIEELFQVECLRYLQSHKVPYYNIAEDGTVSRHMPFEKKEEPVVDSQSVTKKAVPFVMPKQPFNDGDHIFKCPHTGRTFSAEADWKMYKGWSSIIAVRDPKNKPPARYSELARGFRFACPYAGCKRGSNVKDDVIRHICRHHELGDPKKPVPKRKRQRYVPSKLECEQKRDISVFNLLQEPHSEKQAKEFFSTFVERILCTSHGVVKGPLFDPVPSLAKHVALPDVYLEKPCCSVIRPSVPNEVALGAHPQRSPETRGQLSHNLRGDEFASSVEGTVPDLLGDHRIEMGTVPMDGGAVPLAGGGVVRKGIVPAGAVPLPKSKVIVIPKVVVGPKVDLPKLPRSKLVRSPVKQVKEIEELQPKFGEPAFGQSSYGKMMHDEPSFSFGNNTSLAKVKYDHGVGHSAMFSSAEPKLAFEPEFTSRSSAVDEIPVSDPNGTATGIIPSFGSVEPEFEDELQV